MRNDKCFVLSCLCKNCNKHFREGRHDKGIRDNRVNHDNVININNVRDDIMILYNYLEKP